MLTDWGASPIYDRVSYANGHGVGSRSVIIELVDVRAMTTHDLIELRARWGLMGPEAAALVVKPVRQLRPLLALVE